MLDRVNHEPEKYRRWLLGLAASKYVTAWDHWIAFTLLQFLGLHMIYAGLRPIGEESDTDSTKRLHGFWSLAATGFATSIVEYTQSTWQATRTPACQAPCPVAYRLNRHARLLRL